MGPCPPAMQQLGCRARPWAAQAEAKQAAEKRERRVGRNFDEAGERSAEVLLLACGRRKRGWSDAAAVTVTGLY